MTELCKYGTTLNIFLGKTVAPAKDIMRDAETRNKIMM